MSTMSVPPFPPLDLAKLVLGYLAEEQLMTAYDEFLQASPYLDALRNEYDRIFMTSLKNILAEYRAVKIYVETCKPFALRRKLFQCTNLLEVVKFLVNHVDVNKIQCQDTNSFKNSSDKINSSSRLNVCEVCESSKLTSCACKTRPAVLQVPATSTHSTSNSELSARESSVEATALSDLPGNHGPTRKKLMKTLDKESSVSQINSGSGLQDTSVKQSICVLSNVAEENSVHTRHDNMSQNIGMLPKVTDESQEKIKEFNDILHLVCNKNTSNMQQGNVDRRVSNAGTFQDFATGMRGGDIRNINVPDCSNTDNMNMQVPDAKDKISSSKKKKNTKRVKTSQILVVANLAETLKQPSEVIDVDAIDDINEPRIRPKPDQNKIKILSDVKVGNETLNNNLNAVLQNATSTPLLKMQTVLINGTPVYKPITGFANQNYTKDEIMAMPTIIVTPLTGTSQATVSVQSQHIRVPSYQASDPPPPQPGHRIPEFVPVPTSASRSLSPLLIEVSSNDTYTLKKATAENPIKNNLTHQNQADKALITTVNSSNLVNNDAGKTSDAVSASVPKDNVIASGTESSTPQVLPPTRKSSSTPRRTSHVRVLDFTTPRRILHETINEVPNSNSVEVVLSKSPNVVIPNTNLISDNVNCDARDTCDDSEKQTSKENNNTNLAAKKKDWDSDLRALVGGSASFQNKSKQKVSRKKRFEVETKHSDDKDVSSKKKIKPRKAKKDKNEITNDTEKKEEETNSVETKQKVDVPKKPTINIISGQDWEVGHHETEKVQNKSNNDEQDTPELDRLCLEKAIGARLNISDLLETPYKQALYDIQMETPRFLGPDLPGDPPSDIKITNIPTPRFLNSPKGVQATPSYSSRPTDYSSGGSYYKPDDQDYMPLPEQIGYPASTSQENINSESPVAVNQKGQEDGNGNKSKSCRPVRQCAKNVSYFKHQITKTKEDSTKGGNDSVKEDSLSDSSFEHTSSEKKKSKEDTSKKLKENTPRTRPKSDKGRKSISKKYKSPLKKEVSKSFMKIRPRRTTPIKDSKGSKRKSSEILIPKPQNKKRTTSKERNIHATPAAVTLPTKSRRKSSTPRKLHSTKTFNSESSGHNSPDFINKDKPNDHPREVELQCTHDSDTEQLKLRWSDDGSQDAKPKTSQDSVANESEDISKIQEYIQTTIGSKPVTGESEGSLHIDLVKRGFDIETAKIIERDLLDTPPHVKADTFIPQSLQSESKNEEAVLEKTIESESSISNNLQIVQDEQQDEEEEEVEEIELTVHECDEDSKNYFTYDYDDNVDTSKREPVKLKDKFCMEVCIEDGVSIRLRATQCTPLFDLNPDHEKYSDPQDIEETQRAVSSIKFQTPLKDRIKAQCFEIFDSTLTSLDTPLKVDTPRRPDPEVTVTEIVLEVENVEMKEKNDSKKRKRVHSGNLSDDSGAENKKTKSEPQYMLNSANIQNIDIESVLSKLHGP